MKNEQEWLLEALLKLYPNLCSDEREIAFGFAEQWQHADRKSTQRRARKIL